MITKSFRQIKCMKSHIQYVSNMNNRCTYYIQRHNNSNWSMSAVTKWMSDKIKEEKIFAKQLKLQKKQLAKQSKEGGDDLNENIENKTDLIVNDEIDDEDSSITKLDNKSGKIRFQRNVPGEATIYEGEIIGQLQNVKKTKKGMINFHNWEMTRQAVLLCPSAKKGLMPMKKELKFIFPRAVWGVDVHGGFIEVARKLGLKPHRKAPFYIPYLEPNEQYDFVQTEIDKYNEARAQQKKLF
eukprot:428397_1